MIDICLFFREPHRRSSRSKTSVICAYRFVACGPLAAKKDLQGCQVSGTARTGIFHVLHRDWEINLAWFTVSI